RTTGSTRSLTDSFDRHVESFVWTPNSKALFLIAGDEARQPVFKVELSGGSARKILDSHTNDDLQVSPDGKRLIFSHQSLSAPAEVFSAESDGGQLKALTAMNRALLSEVDLSQPESVWFAGDEGVKVQTWIIKPPGFDPAKKYPLLLAIHGGPQGVWGDAMSYRWNGQVFAAQGYVVLMPNPRGSTTFGQKFVDAIRDDWGGRVYEDLMKAVDYALTLGYVDPNQMAAAGGSFGGYMANWIGGHTNRFKCLISHSGVFNLTSMYGVTEELWFPEWEFRGTPWTNRETYEKWSPHNFAKNFKTPLLVIHGELDFRVPIGEGFQLFTYLQRLGVPSKMLYFPDEGHWVLKPANSQLWYKTFLGWLEKYMKGSK
ncbi:MAG: S9 family peptidase, partial [Acidobacteria bacterium]|nr:S9 family peptidase [Acidobacteriota bacterium]